MSFSIFFPLPIPPSVRSRVTSSLFSQQMLVCISRLLLFCFSSLCLMNVQFLFFYLFLSFYSLLFQELLPIPTVDPSSALLANQSLNFFLPLQPCDCVQRCAVLVLMSKHELCLPCAASPHSPILSPLAVLGELQCRCRNAVLEEQV